MMHWQWDWQWILGAAAIFALLLLLAGYGYERFGEVQEAKRHPAPGRMVTVGARRLHILCKGSAVPTVIIEQGAGEPARLWWPVQERVAEFARVCTYDRAGYGWSDAAPAGRTVSERVDELHTLLVNGNVPGPYVFVAHSYGGLMVREFAQKYPGEVAGLVLVDTPEEGTIFRRDVLEFHARMRGIQRVVEFAAGVGVLRLLNHWVALDGVGFPFVRPGEYAAARDDIASIKRVPMAMREPAANGQLGDLPVVVITHGQPFPGPFAVLENGWSEGQQRLAGLSSNGLLIVAHKSNHMIQHDEPELVVDAICRVHAAARDQARLADEPGSSMSSVADARRDRVDLRLR